MTDQTVVEQPTSPPRRRWLDWFAAADPGDTLLLHAVRATLAATASVVAAVVLTHFFAGGQQLTTASSLVLALVTSMLSMVLVSDATIREQKITTLLIVVPIAGSVVVATLVSPLPWLSGILLSGCIFLAYYLRRFGARSAALGLIAVASFLTTLNTRATVVQLPWLLLTAALVNGLALGRSSE